MSRYGPQILPTDVNPLAIAISRFADEFEHSRDRATADAERTRAHGREDVADVHARDEGDVDLENKGWRRGSPAMAALTDLVGPGADRRMPTPGLTPSAPGPSAQAASAGIDANGLAAALRDRTMSLRPPREPAPGSFDGTGFYGITRPRYIQLRPDTATQEGSYIDTEATPRAEAARDRAAQLKAAADYRRGDIGARGNEALDLERARQGGREDLEGVRARNRAQLDADRATERARLAGIVHDFRTAEIGTRGAQGGGKQPTPTQREALNSKIADRLVQEHNGDVAPALDLLTSDDGVTERRYGLSRSHLIAAQGRYLQKREAAAEGIFKSGMAKSIDEARGMLDRGAQPPPGASPTSPAAPVPRVQAAPVAAPPAAPAVAPKVDPSTRARVLRASGRSNAEILRIMKSEGYDVVDSTTRP